MGLGAAPFGEEPLRFPPQRPGHKHQRGLTPPLPAGGATEGGSVGRGAPGESDPPRSSPNFGGNGTRRQGGADPPGKEGAGRGGRSERLPSARGGGGGRVTAPGGRPLKRQHWAPGPARGCAAR